MSTRIRPLLRWPGGKSRLLGKLLPLIQPHECYCEPFMGGMAVFLAKEQSKCEVLNDLNGELVSLFNNIKLHNEALVAEMQFVLNSRETLFKFMAQPGITEIQRAARWLVRNKISFGGGMTTFGVSKTGGGAGISRERMLEHVRELNHRLDKTIIENYPYEKILKIYDSKDTFFFIDPPYLEKPTNNYKGFTKEQMAELGKRVKSLKSNWVLTVDDSEFNRELFKGYEMEAVVTASGCVNRGKSKKTFGELIIHP